MDEEKKFNYSKKSAYFVFFISVILGTFLFFLSIKSNHFPENFKSECLKQKNLTSAAGLNTSTWGKKITFPDNSYFVPDSYNYLTSYEYIAHPLADKNSPPEKWRVSGLKSIRLINDIGYFVKKYLGEKNLYLGDMYDGGNWHVDHNDLYSFDIYSGPGSSFFRNQVTFATDSSGKRGIKTDVINEHYSAKNTEILAKYLIQTRNVDHILYSDSEVIKNINDWAEKNGYKSLSGKPIMGYWNNLFDHFHVQLRTDTTYCGSR